MYPCLVLSWPCFILVFQRMRSASELTLFDSKILSSLITAPFCLRSVIFRLCRHVFTLISSDTKPTVRKEEEFRQQRPSCWQSNGIKISRRWACLYINKSHAVSFFLTDSHNFYKNLLSFNNLILPAQSC